jgi:hypothetical protein
MVSKHLRNRRETVPKPKIRNHRETAMNPRETIAKPCAKPSPEIAETNPL